MHFNAYWGKNTYANKFVQWFSVIRRCYKRETCVIYLLIVNGKSSINAIAATFSWTITHIPRIFRALSIPVYGRFVLRPFQFVAVSVCGLFGLWPFRFVLCSGLWPFRGVAVLTCCFHLSDGVYMSIYIYICIFMIVYHLHVPIIDVKSNESALRHLCTVLSADCWRAEIECIFMGSHILRN